MQIKNASFSASFFFFFKNAKPNSSHAAHYPFKVIISPPIRRFFQSQPLLPLISTTTAYRNETQHNQSSLRERERESPSFTAVLTSFWIYTATPTDLPFRRSIPFEPSKPKVLSFSLSFFNFLFYLIMTDQESMKKTEERLK